MGNKYLNLLGNYKKIETDRLILRPFIENDADDVFEYAKDEETVNYLTWPAHHSVTQSLFAISNFYQAPGIYAIELKESKKCIGCFELRLDASNEKTGFGYVLNRRYWGKGYMTEVLATMIDLSFNVLELNRIESTYYVGNEGSGIVMKKCGMLQEGLALNEIKVKGKFFDVVHMGLLNPNR